MPEPVRGPYTANPKRQGRHANQNWCHNMNLVIINLDQIAEVVQEVHGPAMRLIGRLVYIKPYPKWVDRIHELLKGYKVPKLTLLSGDKNQSTIMHICRFTIQCGEVGTNDFLKLILFPNSLKVPPFPGT